MTTPTFMDPVDPFDVQGSTDLTEHAELISYYLYTEGEIKALEERKKKLRAEIDRLLGDAGVGTVNAREVVKRVKVRRTQFSATRLREERPELYDRYSYMNEHVQMRFERNNT